MKSPCNVIVARWPPAESLVTCATPLKVTWNAPAAPEQGFPNGRVAVALWKCTVCVDATAAEGNARRRSEKSASPEVVIVLSLFKAKS